VLAVGVLLSSPLALGGSSITVASVADARRSEVRLSRQPSRHAVGRENAHGRGAIDVGVRLSSSAAFGGAFDRRGQLSLRPQ
jgi:hypothetical protein